MKIKMMLAAAILLSSSFAVIPNADARRNPSKEKYTVTDREIALDRDIESAYKANQLTLKEADSLRTKMKKIKDKEQSMKDKNAGRLSYEDNTKLEKALNGVSETLQKKQLEKRVQ